MQCDYLTNKQFYGIIYLQRKEKRGNTTMKKGTISTLIAITVLVYSAYCYGEILVKSTKPNPKYSKINIVNLLTNSPKVKAMED